MQDEMADMLEQADEVQEALGRIKALLSTRRFVVYDEIGKKYELKH